MIEFEPASPSDRAAYKDTFDRVMIYDAADLRVIQLAARSRIASRNEAGQKPNGFDCGVMSILPDSTAMMMNPSYISDYCNLVRYYDESGFMYADAEDGVEIGAARDRAKKLVAEIALASDVFEIMLTADFDAFSRATEPIQQIPDEQNKSQE